MIAPVRLLNDANVSEETTSLLRSLSAPELPSVAKQAALARQLASLASPVAAASVGSALSVKAALVIGALGLAGAWTALRVLAPEPSPPTRAPVANVVPPSNLQAAPSPIDAPPVPTPAVPLGAPREPAFGAVRGRSAPRDSLAEEEALLEQARRAAIPAPSQALGILQQYQRHFPAGQLTAERMFLSVDVLTRLGSTGAARRQADALIRAFPSSVYAAQVKAKSSHPTP